jgi:3D-(3,5/4)-trihydroxycyclohexane-1,2-dione acylhydrolase (decyclizing)
MDGVRLIADAKLALTALSRALGGYRAPYKGEIEAVKAKWQAELDRLDGKEITSDYTPEVKDPNSESWKRFKKDVGCDLTQTRALGIVNRVTAPDAVVIGASGSLPGCMQRMWRPRSANTYNMEYGYSCMGYEVSGALGVKLAIGEGREVYAMTGDGSFNMLHSELITSVQEGKKINVLLFDNAGFGCINNLQMGTGNDTMCTELRKRVPGDRVHHNGDFMRIDYAAIARAYGCVAYTVRTAEELEAALEDSKKQVVSTLIDIKVLPKSMTEGYGGWWRVGVAEVSERERVQAARRELEEHLEQARRY